MCVTISAGIDREQSGGSKVYKGVHTQEGGPPPAPEEILIDVKQSITMEKLMFYFI